jgi:outer membrane biogenesis lipoprotein LolB
VKRLGTVVYETLGASVMKKLFFSLLAVAMFGLTGCSEPSPEPTVEPVQQPGQSPMERAMQGMPENQREKYDKQ